ncbi:MAG: uridylate kinase [Methylococcaceae bacterium]|nr:uridylate kinase [Methylococcaceae bacterium]
MIKVIKLGGSLLSDPNALTQCLSVIENAKEKIVIVPGGGVFADQVRVAQQQWKFNEVVAHEMAILAMKQMALLFNSIKPSFVLAETLPSIDQELTRQLVVIWSPDVKVLAASKIEESWDVTSDSLSAWLAGQLNASELIVVKSSEILQTLTVQQMQDQGLVDKAFSRFIKNTDFNIILINKYQLNEYLFT